MWPAQLPKSYAELSRPAETGLIEVVSHGPCGREAYGITEPGLGVVRAWPAADEVDHTSRTESVLRSFFFWLTERDDLAVIRVAVEAAVGIYQTMADGPVGTDCVPGDNGRGPVIPELPVNVLAGSPRPERR
ncbi:hypothetical protein AB0F91_28935 [Amycolatopsis sp. NPDC023774]|uniref:hypothetical protein n=1 Tax=Amycolatopsis sp. NPDC023774 TaxID=3155015 RepID=UPI0033DD7492